MAVLPVDVWAARFAAHAESKRSDILAIASRNGADEFPEVWWVVSEEVNRDLLQRGQHQPNIIDGATAYLQGNQCKRLVNDIVGTILRKRDQENQTITKNQDTQAMFGHPMDEPAAPPPPPAPAIDREVVEETFVQDFNEAMDRKPRTYEIPEAIRQDGPTDDPNEGENPREFRNETSTVDPNVNNQTLAAFTAQFESLYLHYINLGWSGTVIIPMIQRDLLTWGFSRDLAYQIYQEANQKASRTQTDTLDNLPDAGDGHTGVPDTNHDAEHTAGMTEFEGNGSRQGDIVILNQLPASGAAPKIVVESPDVHVAPPSVIVESPDISIAPPSVDVGQPIINIQQPEPLSSPPVEPSTTQRNLWLAAGGVALLILLKL